MSGVVLLSVGWGALVASPLVVAARRRGARDRITHRRGERGERGARRRADPLHLVGRAGALGRVVIGLATRPRRRAAAAEVARAVVQCMSGLPGGLAVDPAAIAALPGWQAYADRLRANEWDAYRVNHTLRTLFGVPFMKRSNPAAFERFDGACRAFESTMSPGVRKVAGEWQTSVPHAGGLRPLTGMVARVLLQEDKVDAARALYEVAQLQVPTYTSWHLEYIYFTLACREKLRGSLTEQDRAEAAAAIAEGNFLLGNGFSESGLTERYVGRLHQLRGEWAEAIPPLLAARPRMRAEDLVACDQALFMSYVRTGNAAAARALADEGMRGAGRFAPVYQRLRSQLGP